MSPKHERARSVPGIAPPRRGVIVPGLLAISVLSGCYTPGGTAADQRGHLFARRWRPDAQPPRVQRVICLYDQKPWLNLDKAGDRDPEGIRYRIFLDGGKSKGVHADGMFHIQMYRIEKTRDGQINRMLVSNWEYPTSKVHTIAKPGMLGDGYFVHLLWGSKDLAGAEVELITAYEDSGGNVARSATKRLRIPKYSV